VTLVMANLGLVGSEMVLVLVQDRCTVCSECTIGMVIILDEINGTPRSRGSIGSLF
jgi:hypothetical protein